MARMRCSREGRTRLGRMIVSDLLVEGRSFAAVEDAVGKKEQQEATQLSTH